MTTPTHYLLQSWKTQEREVHTASNARDLLMHAGYRLVLKGERQDLMNVKDAEVLVPVMTDEKGAVTNEGAAQMAFNNQKVLEIEASEPNVELLDEKMVNADETLKVAPVKMVE